MKDLSSLLKSLLLFCAALLIFLSLFSYNPADISGVSFPSSFATTRNLIGITGAYLGFGLFFLVGRAAYFIPFYLFGMAGRLLSLWRFSGLGRGRFVNSLAFGLFIASLAAFIALMFNIPESKFKYGGIIGIFVADFFKQYLGFPGALITAISLLAVDALLLFGSFFVDLTLGLVKGIIGYKDLWPKLKAMFTLRPIPIPPMPKLEARAAARPAVKVGPEKEKEPLKDKKEAEPLFVKPVKPEIKIYMPAPAPKIDKTARAPVPARSIDEAAALGAAGTALDKEAAKKKMEELEKNQQKVFDPANYKLPSIDLIKRPPHVDYEAFKENIEANIKNLEETLLDFDVEAKVVSVQEGPVVTMYELSPAAGVKITKITSLADDIALAMKSSSVRVVAPIPGRGTVGVEIPKEKKLLVFVREVLEDKAFQDAQSKLTILIGKDVSGNPVVADLKDMPHLLIAGATGSGKTVCVNSLISSILFKARPDEVKFILVDPKMVELATYAGIPHLLHPVICEAKKAFVALNWAVEEMERRYRVLAAKSVRNIDGYNKSDATPKLPYIVIVIDELADMMIVARESVETSIQRLAQLSRAVGIHLIIATQRPSVDVITGVIKANFPARISFKVASKVDSRTVLDVMGAERLLGKGDLLFLKPGAPKLIRAQGAFIDDEDIEKVTDFIREQGGPVYEQAIAEGNKKAALNIENDELYDEAVKVVMAARQASASILQRRMRVGYTRAARLLDLMEQNGLVGPFCGSKAREILTDPVQYVPEGAALDAADAAPKEV